ncbi:MAG: hypothetical protein J0L61_05865 [Planctomycetes bacterium]|nr:hypothetical protein [Planctomycetota bacterium]
MNPCANTCCNCSNPDSTITWAACASAWKGGTGAVSASGRVAIVNGVLSLVRRLDRGQVSQKEATAMLERALASAGHR